MNKSLKTTQKDKSYFKEGQRLMNKYPDLREATIQRTIDETCTGEYDNPYHRKLAREALEKK
jgi:hypothetical protein